MRRIGVLGAVMIVAVGLSACSPGSILSSSFAPMPAVAARQPAAAETAIAAAEEEPVVMMAFAPSSLDGAIARAAARHDVPEELIRRVIDRESDYNPNARNGPYWGLMQISYATAQSMGYRGSASGLLDPETNLEYAVKYLRGAWIVADGNQNRAIGYYASGYYYAARDRGLLEETGLR